MRRGVHSRNVGGLAVRALTLAAIAAIAVTQAPLAAQQQVTYTQQNRFAGAVLETAKAAKQRTGQPVPLNKWEEAIAELKAKGWKTWADYAVNSWPRGLSLGEDRPCAKDAHSRWHCISTGSPRNVPKWRILSAETNHGPGWPAEQCDKLGLNFGPDGRLPVPAMVLPFGQPIKNNDPIGGSDLQRKAVGRNEGFTWARPWGASARRSLHLWNAAQGDRRNWSGAYSVSPFGDIRFRTLAYLDPDGIHYSPTGERFTAPNGMPTTQVLGGNFPSASPPKPCPEGGSGDDMDFYYDGGNYIPEPHNAFRSCVWYVKNRALSPSGYAEATFVGGPTLDEMGHEESVGGGSQANHCPMARAAIVRAAQDLLNQVDGSTGVPATPVLPADVRECGQTATLRDWALDLLNVNGCSSTPSSAPPPAPQPDHPDRSEPIPSQGGGGGGGASLDLSHPEVASSQENPPSGNAITSAIEAFAPDIPNIGIPEMGDCPTYAFNIFGSTQTIDAHCELYPNIADQLNFVMIVVWGLTAFFIVLRA